MSEVSIEGLRQGFLDHESRIRLNSDTPPKEHSNIIAIAWEGGLLDKQSLAFNSGLNVLIGGRGAGKSTVIESVRHVFDLKPKGKDAACVHEAMTKDLLGPKSAVSVLIQLPEPSPAYYLVERAFGQRPQVRNQFGNIVENLHPGSLLPSLEVYGQHEISELTRDKGKLAEILTRFVGKSDFESVELDGIKAQLTASRRSITTKLDRLEELNQALTALPSLKEQLKRFEETDLAEKLREKTSVQTEMRIIDGVCARVGSLRTYAAEIDPGDGKPVPIFSSEEDPDLPNRAVLEPLEAIAAGVDAALNEAAATLTSAADRLDAEVGAVRASWMPLSEAAEKRYEELVKTLRAEGHDPERYVSITQQVAALIPKEKEKARLEGELTNLRAERREILDALDRADREAFQGLIRAARVIAHRVGGKMLRATRGCESTYG